MKPVQIRRPLVKALEKLDVDISKIPDNMLSHFVRRIKKTVNNKICDWMEMRLHRTDNLDALAKAFVEKNIDAYAAMLKRTLREDVLVA